MSKFRQHTRGVAQDHNIAVVLTLYKKGSQAMLNNKFKYWEGQSLCIRLNYRTGYCTHESVPLCHDLLRLSLCSAALYLTFFLKVEYGALRKTTLKKKNLKKYLAKPANSASGNGRT